MAEKDAGKSKKLDARTAKSLKPGEWARAAVAGKRGGGILEARGLAGGVTYYLRLTTPNGRERIALGAVPYADAVRAATAHSLRYQSGERALPDTLQAEAEARSRQRAEAKQAATLTLGRLMEGYCIALERAGAASVKDVRRTIHLHIAEAWPRLWAKRADAVELEELADVVNRVADAGKLHMARNVRAYIRAAYAAGMKAASGTVAPPELRELKIKTNPAALLAPIDGASTAGERALSVAELRHYWRRIEAMPGVDGGLLRFHLLTGCQRIAQLGRATWQDYDTDSQTLRLLDSKGKRSTPRVHIVPVIPEALDAAHAMAGTRHIFTVTAGLSGATKHVLAARIGPVVEAMQAAGELEGEPFTAADLRRTVETRLAALGVPPLVRAHLQSHGLGGVQIKHYDRHDYLAEKRAALETLHRLLTGTQADVVPIRKAGA